MGQTASNSAALEDVRARIRQHDAALALAALRAPLQAAFDGFVAAHCELAHDAHVGVIEMQSAIVAYLETRRLQGALVRWARLRPDRPRHVWLFDEFGQGVAGVEASGMPACRVLAGIRVRRWPRDGGRGPA